MHRFSATDSSTAHWVLYVPCQLGAKHDYELGVDKSQHTQRTHTYMYTYTQHMHAHTYTHAHTHTHTPTHTRTPTHPHAHPHTHIPPHIHIPTHTPTPHTHRAKNSVKHFPVRWDGKEFSFGFGKFSTVMDLLEHFESKPVIGGESGMVGTA